MKKAGTHNPAKIMGVSTLDVVRWVGCISLPQLLLLAALGRQYASGYNKGKRGTVDAVVGSPLFFGNSAYSTKQFFFLFKKCCKAIQHFLALLGVMLHAGAASYKSTDCARRGFISCVALFACMLVFEGHDDLQTLPSFLALDYIVLAFYPGLQANCAPAWLSAGASKHFCGRGQEAGRKGCRCACGGRPCRRHYLALIIPESFKQILIHSISSAFPLLYAYNKRDERLLVSGQGLMPGMLATLPGHPSCFLH
eukprot:373502-Pelagomonas_calceolata.AAC.2